MDDDDERPRAELRPGECRVLLLGAAADGVEPSLLVTAHSGAQYAFDVPEGFSRLALESRARPTSKLRACFSRGGSSGALGGLVGLILRLAADGHERLAVVGPRGTIGEVNGARKCARWLHPEVQGVDLCSNSKRNGGIGCYADNAITVWPLFLDDTCQCLVCEWEEYRGGRDDSSDECESSEDHKCVPFDQPAECKDRHEDVSPTDSSTCVGYAFELKAEDDTPGVRVAIINVQSSSVIDKLNSNPTLKCFVSEGSHTFDAIFHCTPNEVACNPSYKMWKESLNCEHFSCRAPNELGFRASARMSLRLNCVDPESFPVPKALVGNEKVRHTHNSLRLCSSVCVRKYGPKKCEVDHQSVRSDDVQPCSVLKELAVLRPELASASADALERTRPKHDEGSPEDRTEGSQKVARELKSRLMQGLIGSKRMRTGYDTEIIFLGTGSAEPNKYRGSTGILVKLLTADGESWMMLDCGEGSVGSIQRLLGRSEMLKIVKNLKVVWISHHHADHMLGVRGLLAVRAEVCASSPLVLVGPNLLRDWLETCGVISNSYEFIRSRDLFAGPFGRLPPPPPPLHMSQKPQRVSVAEMPPTASAQMHSTMNLRSSKLIESRIMGITGLSRFEAIPVDHCRDAAALVLGSSSGWSLAYSGDCRPSREFARAAKGCQVMIHEATFDNNLCDHAVRKRHSTTAEALDIATTAEVKYVILTHFSQRYPKAINVEDVEIQPIIAYDGFRVRFSELERVQGLQTAVASVIALVTSSDGDV